jgi:hypothetical protein
MAMGKLGRKEKKPEKKCGRKNERSTKKKAEEAPADGIAREVSADTDSGTGPEEKGETGKGDSDTAGETEERKERAKKALRKALEDAIRRRREEIAESLVNKVIDGDERSTEMMLSLIEKKKKDGATSSRHGGLTAADLLGSEDEWESETDEALEGQADVGIGGREPEG